MASIGKPPILTLQQHFDWAACGQKPSQLNSSDYKPSSDMNVAVSVGEETLRLIYLNSIYFKWRHVMADRFKISDISVEGQSHASAPALRTFTILSGSIQTQQGQVDSSAWEHMDISKIIHKQDQNW